MSSKRFVRIASVPYVVWMAIIYVVVNLITDILYHVLDPRIRLGVQAG